MATADFTRIASNIGALNSLYSLRSTNAELALHQARLSTGKRINSAQEDPAGLSIATKMGARAEGLSAALDNIGDAQNMLSVAEAGLSKINDILVEMRTKAEVAASDTLGAAERAAIQSQLDAWSEEINSIVDTTKWNGQKLLDGLAGFSGNVVTFQVGADTDAANRITLTNTNFDSVYTYDLGIASASASVSGWTQTGAGGNESSGAASAVFAGLSELASGSYKIVVSAAASNAAVVQLQDANGNVVQIDADGTDTAADILADSRTVNLSGGATINFGNGVTLTIASGTVADGDSFTVDFDYSKAGTYNGDVSSASGARNAVDLLDAAITQVSGRLTTIGAVAGRLSFREETISVAQANTESAYSRIMDADMAYEQVMVTKESILQQTSMSMLSQANQMPQNILSLFRG